ncbi:MAG TPA: glutamine synthetase beta-grasp domain-containing protein, partial [Anaerolineales bacterium]|nr:glutamine synthetase beta-grasp domain-containing protein [Anaerolineales bacterium]
MAKTVKDVLALAKNTQMVDFRFIDLPGTWQHFSIPSPTLDESIFEEGIGFDGSSIRGFKEINESDMLLLPDPNSAFVDPVLEVPTLVLICDVYDPITSQPYERDPRFIARKAEEYLKKSKIADVSYWGPEAEFFLFSDVRYGGGTNSSFYYVDSNEGWWKSGEDTKPNFGGQIAPKRGYFPTPPADTLQDIRSKIVLSLIAAGVDVEVHHHEVATAGQCEIDMR